MAGGHAARSARRKLNAIRSGRVLGHLGRGRQFRAKGARGVGQTGARKSRLMAARRQSTKDAITYPLSASFECPAESDSNLSACVARHGGSAVRVSKPDGPDSNLAGPTQVCGRAVTWRLDLHHPSASKRVSPYLEQWKPRHVWLFVPCTSRTHM